VQWCCYARLIELNEFVLLLEISLKLDDT